MSSQANDPKVCDLFRDDLAETALGVASGRRRSEVLRHVESCPSCSLELEQLSIVADTMMELSGESEPPVGFELRLAQRLQSGVQRRPTRRARHVSVLLAAAAVAVALGIGIGALTSSGGRNTPNQAMTDITSANLSSGGHVLGEFLVSAGKPAWMYMTVDSGTWSGVVTCQVILAGGKIETVGQFTLSGGYGAWGAPLTTSAGQVRGARLVDASGTVIASARIPA